MHAHNWNVNDDIPEEVMRSLNAIYPQHPQVIQKLINFKALKHDYNSKCL